MPKFQDLTLITFGDWTVLERAANRCGQTMWRCRCACGAIQECSGGNLRNGVSVKCRRCSNKEIASRNVTHGMSRSPLFVAWFAMLQRCTNPSHKSYAYYGGRGVEVCERWREFQNFHDDMGDRPDGYSLDRIDNNSHYCKENCRWVSRVTQMRNTRSNRLLTFRGQTKTQAEWAGITGIHQRTISERLLAGWDVETALTRKPGSGKRKREQIRQERHRLTSEFGE